MRKVRISRQPEPVGAMRDEPVAVMRAHVVVPLDAILCVARHAARPAPKPVP